MSLFAACIVGALIYWILPTPVTVTPLCESTCDGMTCQLPAGHKERHRCERPSDHPTYHSIHCFTWRDGEPDEEPDDAPE